MFLRLARHSAWLLMARLGTQIGMALFTILLARRLGSAGFGEYAFIAALLVIGNALTTFGTDMHLIRQIAAGNDLSMLPAALTLQIVISCLFIAAVLLAAPFFTSLTPDGMAALRVYSFSLFPLAFFTVFTTALRGKQQMEAYTLLNLALAAMQVMAALIIFIGRGDLVTLAWLLVLVQAIAAWLAGIFCKVQITNFFQNRNISVQNILLLVQASLPMALLGGLGILYQRLTLTLLPFLAGAAQTGIFSAAARSVEAAKLGHIAMFTAIYPMMSASKEQGANWLKSFRLPWGILIAMATAAGLALSFLARPLVTLLFGVEYADSVPVLRILAWTLIPYTLNTFLSLALLAEGRETIITGASITSLCGLAVTTLWGGWVAGAIGAAWAVLVIESVQSVILRLAVSRVGLSLTSGGANEFSDLSRKV